MWGLCWRRRRPVWFAEVDESLQLRVLLCGFQYTCGAACGKAGGHVMFGQSRSDTVNFLATTTASSVDWQPRKPHDVPRQIIKHLGWCDVKASYEYLTVRFSVLSWDQRTAAALQAFSVSSRRAAFLNAIFEISFEVGDASSVDFPAEIITLP